MINFCSFMLLQLATINYNTNPKKGGDKHKTFATQAKKFGGYYFRYRIRFVSAMSPEEKLNWFPLLNLTGLKCGEKKLQIASADVKAIVRTYQFYGCSNKFNAAMPTAHQMLNKFTAAKQSLLDVNPIDI